MDRVEFAIGLGNGANSGFLEEISETTNGKYDFVYDISELMNKVKEHIELALNEIAINCEIHFTNDKAFQVAPYPLKLLMNGTVQHIFIKEEDDEENEDNVLITAKLSEEDKEIEFIVDCEFIRNYTLKMNEKNPILPLFTQKQLKLIADDEENSVRLSIESGVLCKYTSYIEKIFC